MERRSVMASTADIQVNAKRGRTTQELHREALDKRQRERQAARQRGRGGGKEMNEEVNLKPDRASFSHII